MTLIIRDRAHLSIGRSFSVERRVWAHFATSEGRKEGYTWLKGNGYNYGMLPPRYPVPALYHDRSNPTVWDWMRDFQRDYGIERWKFK